jgi:hypothetical protein
VTLPIVATFTTTPEMARASYRVCTEPWLLLTRVFLMLALLAGLSATVRSLSAGDGAPPVALFLTAVPPLVLLLHQRMIRAQLAPYLDGPVEITVTLTDSEYRVGKAGVTNAQPWTAFRRVTRSGDFWVLRTSRLAATALPAAALDDGQTAAFRSLLRDKGLSRR